MGKTYIVLAALLALPGAAWAQEAGGGGAAPPAGGAAARGGGGFVVTDEEDTTSVYGAEQDETSPAEGGPTGRAVPPVHVVKKGDTLWDICKQYFGNPWQWPKVWSYNPGITNPHWIFPGDQVHLTSASSELPQTADMPAQAPSGKRARIARLGGNGAIGGNAMRELGFVEEGELKAAATIVGSREEKMLLATGDQAYVEYPQDRPLHVGERYTVYKIEREVHHPVTKARIGYVVLIMGEVQVDQITQGAIARSSIVDSNSAIERGYRVGPLARRWKNIEARKNGGQVEGYVVSALRPLDIIDSEEIVFVDKGQKEGVVDGNRFFVVRRGDGYKKLLSDESTSDDPRYPKEVVAEVLVIEAHDHTSVGYISRANKEVHPGDRVEMRRGY
jgi:hypothetical protein